MEFNPFDTSAKELVWDEPPAWVQRFGSGPPGPVEVIDSDITALSASADKVLKVGGPHRYSRTIAPRTSSSETVAKVLAKSDMAYGMISSRLWSRAPQL